jgi:hypothetical protein
VAVLAHRGSGSRPIAILRHHRHGWFVGLAKHDVAIPVGLFRDDKDKFVLAGATKDALKAMPKFEDAK